MRSHSGTANSLLALLIVAALSPVGQSSGIAASPASSPVATTAPPGVRQVMSDDGSLTLWLPEAAVPPGVVPSIARIHPDVPAITAYELRPIDLSLPTSATVTWQLDPTGTPAATNGDLVWLAMARAADPVAGPWEWLADPHLTVLGGAYAITGQLTRFGTLVVTLLDTRIRGPEAIWGPGYELPIGVPVDLPLTLVSATGTPGTAAFSGDQRFGGGYPDRISVVPSAAEADVLDATWQCRRAGATSLATSFAIREAPTPDASGARIRIDQIPGLPPAGVSVSVTFPVTCGVMHPNTDG